MGLMAQQSLLWVNRIFLVMLYKSMDALWIAGQQHHPFHGLPGLTCTFQTMTYIYSCIIFLQQLNVGCCMQKFECWWLEDRMLNSWIPLLSVAQHGPQMSSYYYSPSRRNDCSAIAANLHGTSFWNPSMLLQKPSRRADRTLTLTLTMTLKWRASKVKKNIHVFSTFFL